MARRYIQPEQIKHDLEPPPFTPTHEPPAVGELVTWNIGVVPPDHNGEPPTRTTVVGRVRDVHESGRVEIEVVRWAVHESLLRRLPVIDQLAALERFGVDDGV